MFDHFSPVCESNQYLKRLSRDYVEFSRRQTSSPISRSALKSTAALLHLSSDLFDFPSNSKEQTKAAYQTRTGLRRSARIVELKLEQRYRQSENNKPINNFGMEASSVEFERSSWPKLAFTVANEVSVALFQTIQVCSFESSLFRHYKLSVQPNFSFPLKKALFWKLSWIGQSFYSNKILRELKSDFFQNYYSKTWHFQCYYSRFQQT